ncbi:hypothetical protein GCM10020001_071240 [Nonomuraea salmonea]
MRQKTGMGNTLRTASGSPSPSGRASRIHGGIVTALTMTVKSRNARHSPATRSSTTNWRRLRRLAKKGCVSFTR